MRIVFSLSGHSCRRIAQKSRTLPRYRQPQPICAATVRGFVHNEKWSGHKKNTETVSFDALNLCEICSSLSFAQLNKWAQFAGFCLDFGSFAICFRHSEFQFELFDFCASTTAASQFASAFSTSHWSEIPEFFSLFVVNRQRANQFFSNNYAVAGIRNKPGTLVESERLPRHHLLVNFCAKHCEIVTKRQVFAGQKCRKPGLNAQTGLTANRG